MREREFVIKVKEKSVEKRDRGDGIDEMVTLEAAMMIT